MDYVDINALIFDNLESVEFLLKNGVNVNSRDYQYKTPLMYAVQKNNAKIVKLLISKVAYINIKDYRNRTDLDMAKLKGYNNAKKNIKK